MFHVTVSHTDEVDNSVEVVQIGTEFNKTLMKSNWIGHILRRTCLLKQVIEGKIKGEMEVTRR